MRGLRRRARGGTARARLSVDMLRLSVRRRRSIPSRVADIAGRLLDIGVYEVAISDTIGAATPGDVLRVLGAVSARLPLHQVALHFHDTRGTALANVLAGLDYGVTTFDSSAGGLGGCPFAPGAAGNLATEDLLFMLNGLGIETGVSIDDVAAASRSIETTARSPLPSRFLRAPAISLTATLNSELLTVNLMSMLDPSGRGLGRCRLLARRLQGGYGLTRKFQRLSCLKFPCLRPRSPDVTRYCRAGGS